MKTNSKNDTRAFVDRMNEAYRNQSVCLPKQKYTFKSGALFGLITMYVGAIPLIIFKADSGLWSPLAVWLCLLCLAVGVCQMGINEVRSKRIEIEGAK